MSDSVKIVDGDILQYFNDATFAGKLVCVFLRGVLRAPLQPAYRVKKGRGQRRNRRNRGER